MAATAVPTHLQALGSRFVVRVSFIRVTSDDGQLWYIRQQINWEPEGEKWLQIQDRIRPVLAESWDPLGYGRVFKDEYDGYISEVYSLFASSARIEEIADYLGMVETAKMSRKSPTLLGTRLNVALELATLDLPKLDRSLIDAENPDREAEMRRRRAPAGWRRDLELSAVGATGGLEKIKAVGFRWEIESDRWVDIQTGQDDKRPAMVHFSLWYGDRSKPWGVHEYLMLALVPLGDAVSLEYLRRGAYSHSIADGEVKVCRQTPEERQASERVSFWSDENRVLSLVDSYRRQSPTHHRAFRIPVWDDHGIDLRFREARGGEAAIVVSIHKQLACKVGDEYRTLRLVPILGNVGSVTLGFEETTAVFTREDVPFRP